MRPHLQPHHDGSPLYVSDPAPALGGTVTVFARVPRGSGVRRVFVRTTPDGEPRFARARIDRRTRTETWYRADVEVRNPLTRYRFLLDSVDGHRWLTAAGVVDHEVPDATDFRLVADAPPPAWAADAVVYQIFPDRFARSPAVAGRPVPRWAIPCDWDDPVIGRGRATPRQLYGGDLDGIAARLDHIAALGADTVYLTPIFPAGSSHRYDASSFTEVDPLLGGDEALKRLADAVHARGMRLVGDITTNHCGIRHPWFRQRPDMFYVDDQLRTGYESWLGVRTLPKLNWGSGELRRRFFDGPDAVVARWLDRFDGWRVDVANMTGRLGADDHAHDVARSFRAAALRARHDALIVAEHTQDASGDLDRGGWHGTMNYPGFLRPVWSWLAPQQSDVDFLGLPVPLRRRPGGAAVAAMRAFAAQVSWRSYTASWNLLGSHDTARIRTVVGSAALVEVAAGLLATMPGTPMVYAGDEIGLTGHWGEDARTPYPWHRPETWDRAALDRYRTLLALRRTSPALRHGGLRWLHVDDDTLAYLRETPDQRLLILARRAPGTPLTLRNLRTLTNLYGGAPPGPTLPADGPTFQIWTITDA